jgi:hypothetical protein
VIELLYQALVEEIGIVVSCTDPEKLRNRLYLEKKKDPEFEKLSFFISPINPTSELWIAKIDGEL